MSQVLDSILAELREEAPATRGVLARIPNDKLAWKPHDKSRSLGELAAHVARIPAMAERILAHDEFAAGTALPPIDSADEIRATFETSMALAEKALAEASDETANGSWSLVFRGKVIFTKKRTAALRTNMLNHIYHHRGQLSVYLRLLDIPVPVVYGPTADENPFA